MSIARWLNWQPKEPISARSPESEPTKPSKPSSVGFVGSEVGESQEIAGGFVGSVGPDLRESRKIALATVKASNARMATHNGQRIVAVSPAEDSPALREALEALGYGGCRVLHIETAPLRGQSSAAVAEAIEKVRP